jgi:hypothetical protein
MFEQQAACCQNNREFFFLSELSGCLSLVFSPSTASHVSFANNVVSIGNKQWVNHPSISHIKIAFPLANYLSP